MCMEMTACHAQEFSSGISVSEPAVEDSSIAKTKEGQNVEVANQGDADHIF